MFRSKYMKNLPACLYADRLSEIALAFYFDKIGKIGFINKPMSVYRQHTNGVWSGALPKEQFLQWLKIRQTCMQVCKEKYVSFFERAIAARKQSFESEK